jgi:hypothetical protein
MGVKKGILLGSLIVIVSLIRTFLGWEFISLFLLVVFLPPFLFWLPLSKLSGRLLLDLGHPRTRLFIVSAIICGIAGLITLADLLLGYYKGTAHLRDLPLPVFFLWLMTFMVLAHRRQGLSIREEGILDTGTLFRWQEVGSYTFEEGTAKLTVHVNGVGLLHAFVSTRPPSCVKTWPIPAEQQAAARQILAQRVPAQAAEKSPEQKDPLKTNQANG